MRNQTGKERLCGKLLEVFKVLAENKRLGFFENNTVKVKNSSGNLLFFVDSQNIATPATDISDSIFSETSPLADTFVSEDDLLKLVRTLNNMKAVEHLDHIGFCYKVFSQDDELERIKSSVVKTQCHLYEMASNDLAKWYFLGDRKNWQDPLIELLPTLPNNDRDQAYWLPHVQIDTDTYLAAEEIEKIIYDVFGKTRMPLRIGGNGKIYCVRIWLGVIAGVNIELDLATNLREPKYTREHLLKTLI